MVGITTSGKSPNVLRALEAAKRHRRDDGRVHRQRRRTAGAELADIVLLGPHGYSALVQEVHITLGHIICDLVEQDLLFA